MWIEELELKPIENVHHSLEDYRQIDFLLSEEMESYLSSYSFHENGQLAHDKTISKELLLDRDYTSNQLGVPSFCGNI